MSYGQVNADVIGTSVAGSNLGAGDASLMKSRIINGAMVIDQRNAGASVTGNDGVFPVDRWKWNDSQDGKFTLGQNLNSVTPPAGFVNYLGAQVSSSVSIGSGDYFIIRQNIEGYNIADWNWGTANAKTVTLSFQVYSSLTGTFGGALQNSANNQAYPFTYTVSSANTWTQISLTIIGPTSGTWLTTNGRGVVINFGLGVGSTYSGTAGSWNTNYNFSATGATSVVGTNGATFYITGVQLEVGSSATGYEYRQYGTELALCQRYYQKFLVDRRVYSTTPAYWGTETKYTVPMRANPTTSQGTPAAVSGVDGSSFQDISSNDNQSMRTQFLTNVTNAGAYLLQVPIMLTAEL